MDMTEATREKFMRRYSRRFIEPFFNRMLRLESKYGSKIMFIVVANITGTLMYSLLASAAKSMGPKKTIEIMESILSNCMNRLEEDGLIQVIHIEDRDREQPLH